MEVSAAPNFVFLEQDFRLEENFPTG